MIVFLFLFFQPLFSAEIPAIYLGIGESHELPSSPLTPLTIQKSGLVKVKDQGKKLRLIGQKVGNTRVQLGQQSFEVVVLKKPRHQALQALQKWQVGKRGPNVMVQNGQVLVRGRILSLQDLIELPQVVPETAEFQMSASLDPAIQTSWRTYIDNQIRSQHLPIGFLSDSGPWQMQITEKDRDFLGRLRGLLGPYGISVSVNQSLIKTDHLIRIQVYIAQVKRDFLRQWGMQWPSQFSTVIDGMTAPRLTAFELSLQSLESQGEGRVLAEPVLVAQSGEPAQFHSGGEFPVRTTTQFNNNVEWKSYGLFLKTKGVITPAGHLKLAIEVELSSIDQAAGTDGVPGLSRSHMQTHVHLKSPQPIVLSGLFQKNSGQSKSGLAWLSQIPIFAPLFSSNNIFDSEQELVFVLIPEFHG